ncbi:DNA-directed RNA polymerase subunit delta [Kurthia senegalensis]|uniref:DNA-directed RNA polymerase subunit delta n=1 Tax=Kurthia senegalensis TaxID=1033740 RepID=UPI000289F706|nr:DNA-directed RNA polymerase subunit delta [Kurthia senegalensis]
MNFRELSKDQLAEESLIELANSILVEQGQPITFQEIVSVIKDLGARTEAQIKAEIVQFYTDMNIDGRFIVLGENRWGLREWYAIDQVEEETAPTVKAHKHEEVEDLELEIDEDESEELELDDDENDFDDSADLDDDEEEDELAGLDVVEEGDIDLELDEEDDEDEEDDLK